MFSCFYLSNDYENKDMKSNADWPNFLNMVNFPFHFSLGGWLDKIPWWRRLNLVPNPYDKNGVECKNDFDDLLD